MSLDPLERLIELYLEATAAKWHSQICDRLLQLEAEQRRTTEDHEALIQEQKRFKALAIALGLGFYGGVRSGVSVDCRDQGVCGWVVRWIVDHPPIPHGTGRPSK